MLPALGSGSSSYRGCAEQQLEELSDKNKLLEQKYQNVFIPCLQHLSRQVVPTEYEARLFATSSQKPSTKMSSASPEATSIVLPVVLAILVARIGFFYLYKPQKCPFLTNHELKIVQDSWVEVEKIGLAAVGVLLFKNIFSAAPSALLFFSFKDEPNLFESKAFKKHAISVVGTVGVAVKKLDDVPNLVPVLQALGAKHATMGQEGNRIVKAHYDLVGQQLIVSRWQLTNFFLCCTLAYLNTL